MSRNTTRKSKKGRFPCRCCFLRCEPYTSGAHRRGGGVAYPCSDELRLWASAHRGDPPGFVVEGRAR